MPFGLKNAGATYQSLVNKMFANYLGDTIEVYINDMLVKSLNSNQYIDHLCQAFKVLQKYNMKLNSTKCSFSITSCKFLSFMVTQRGIEANPYQIRSIINIPSPACVRDVQCLAGHVAALSRFISCSLEKCHLFFSTLHKSKDFEWTLACGQAL